MGWQQDGAHGAAHRSSDRSLASNWPSRQIGGSIRGYPARPSARWPARRAQSTIIAQAGTLYSYALPTASRTRASAASRAAGWCRWGLWDSSAGHDPLHWLPGDARDEVVVGVVM